MEAAAGVTTAGRGVSLPMNSSQLSRKEWRVVSEQSVRNSSNEELERSKLGQSDERLIYEVQQGREAADVDFCSISIDGNLDSDILQQRLHSVVKQREELQQMEVDIQAQLIARGEIMEMRNTYDAQIKDRANANVKLQEQLREKEQRILELERNMEEKERELHSIRLDNEAVWAKEDLLREQSKELQSYRRERDNSEAEIAQHIKQTHDLQENIQEKDRQFMELQEQNRLAQETIIFKDEQLREAQAWITRVQEMDAFQSTTLQSQLQDRAEQYNQLLFSCQRQFGEMERLHLHIQQLQIELAETRERSGMFSDGSHVSHTNSKDVSPIGQSNSSQLDMSGGGTPGGCSANLPNGNADNASFVSLGNASVTEHAHGVTFAPTSMLGMPPYIQPGQLSALHSIMMHQQGVPHSVPTHVQQSHVGHFHPMQAMSFLQQWHNPQAVSESAQMTTQDQHPSLQTETALLRPETNYDYDSSVHGQVIHPDYMNVKISQGMEPHSVAPPSNVDGQVLDSIDKSYLSNTQSQPSLQQISAQFHDALRLDPLEHSNDKKEKNVENNVSPLEAQGLTVEKPGSTSNVSSSEEANHTGNFGESTMNTVSDVVSSDSFASACQKNTTAAGKLVETPLLDERSLLACIVRTIPPGGRIHISSTLPNRLGKMIAPLHWHDYKRKYGKLDEFVSSHPELFVIDGDYIQLREGAQEIIAAMAAVAKVAAAAATLSYSSVLPSVSVTPMAQSCRLKKAPSLESTSGKSDSSMFKEYVASRPPNGVNSSIQISAMHNPPTNGVSFIIAGVGNGTNSDENDFGSSPDMGSNHWRASNNVVGKKQSRTIGAATSSRR